MIYIHIPYCHGKCTYCAFYSIASTADKTAYVNAVCEELKHRSAEKKTKATTTIYFGGGTPSILTIELLRQIINTLNSCYDLSAVEECTIECNPEDLTDDYIASLRGLNFFNRISIGVQSFSDSDLHLLRRRHSAEQAITAIHKLGDAGFNNISIDLIYGLPNQSTSKWAENLKQVRLIDPNHYCVQHLSCYALSVEPHTILERQIRLGELSPANEDTVVEQYNLLTEWCDANHFEQYEISNFCTAGNHSRHNSRYWTRTPYLGIGAAAHSFDGQHRRWNVSDIRKYIDGVTKGTNYFECETLTASDVNNEYVMTALRTAKGIDKKIIAPYIGIIDAKIRRFVDSGLIIDTGDRYTPSRQGLLHADGIAAELFVD